MDVSTHIQTYKIYKDIKLNHKKCIKCIRKCFDLILLSKFLMAESTQKIHLKVEYFTILLG